MKLSPLHMLVAAALSVIPYAADAEEEVRSEFSRAFIDGTPYLQLRYRYEYVDQEGLSRNARASSLRTTLGFSTAAYRDFVATLELQNIAHLGNDLFNDTVNGKTTYPVVADPDDSEINQAFLSYSGISGTNITAGRYKLNLDNQRFIGSVDWRQNDQTFDGGTIVYTGHEHLTLRYGYVFNVNRIFGDDSPVGDLKGSNHILHASYDGWSLGIVTAYGYLLDSDDAPASSSNSYGLSLNGKRTLGADAPSLLYYLEYAHQDDTGRNPIDYNAHYYHLSPGIAWNGLVIKAGLEALGSDDGRAAFQTPLATLHKFNGFADKFLTTPAAGLEDYYLSATYTTPAGTALPESSEFSLAYHSFRSEENSIDYGDEWDATATTPFMEHYTVGLKYAFYDADRFATDTHKAALWLSAAF